MWSRHAQCTCVTSEQRFATLWCTAWSNRFLASNTDWTESKALKWLRRAAFRSDVSTNKFIDSFCRDKMHFNRIYSHDSGLYSGYCINRNDGLLYSAASRRRPWTICGWRLTLRMERLLIYHLLPTYPQISPSQSLFLFSFPSPCSLVHPFMVTATGTASPAAGNLRWLNLNPRKQDGNHMQ